MSSIKASSSSREPVAAYASRGAQGGASIQHYLHAASALERDHMVREGFEARSLDDFAHRFGRSGRSLAQLWQAHRQYGQAVETVALPSA